ncbi:M23 family metallopeptidase [Fictibacillus phosphorivorans]|uniref:M23 family metallopeptidase n=1 Tax=Fictibacillus phosphorivorans TaxID=1221500 RepID=UPI0021B455B5|nr:M23 family metallopeptidase [Fictibacillus phosphorivorans]
MNNLQRCITGETFGAKFLKGEFQAIYNHTASNFKDMITIEQFMELSSSFNSGVQHYSLESETRLTDHLRHYLWLDNEKIKAISVTFDSEDVIQSLLLAPFETYPETDNQLSKNTYMMPIQDEWFVFWGGANHFINYHYEIEEQRYAYDLVIVKDGQSYRGTPTLNEDFYAFNKEVVAPCDGRVVKVVNSIVDNEFGSTNVSNPEGNYVIIQHANDEYSLIAHFKQNSIVVKDGQMIKQSQLVGYCGNSGNSSEPHIHFQVMNSPNHYNGKSIRIRFHGDYEPIQGDVVTSLKDI